MRSPYLAHLNSLKKSNTDKSHAVFLHLVPGAHTAYPHMHADVGSRGLINEPLSKLASVMNWLFYVDQSAQRRT